MLQMRDPRFFWLSLLLFMSFCIAPMKSFNATAAKADVGVILDLDTTVGKIIKTCISMAIEDFYSKHNYTTMIVPHFRNSSSDVIAAASAAIDLLKNTQVVAIFGPQRSIQADFVIGIGDKVRVPIISPSMSPALSPQESEYFIRSAWSSSAQAEAVAAIVKAFGWREVVFIYENTNYGSALVPSFSEKLLQINALVSNQSAISPSARNDQILLELTKLMTMQTRVFIVHMLPDLASRFFRKAKEAGMMNKGYAWIIADVLTSLLDTVDSDTIEAMQGVLGVKAHIPRSSELNNFARRWSKRFPEENPDMDGTKLNVFGLWAYDSIAALAEAIEQVGVTSPQFNKSMNRGKLTDLEAIGTSNTGERLASLIRNFPSKGLSGDFNITDGQLQPSVFEIVNVIGKGETTVGFWTENYGISKELNSKTDDDLAIVWPGKTIEVPKGWEIPTSGKKLRVGVPVEGGISDFIKVERDAKTKAVIATGFFIDVFEEVMRSLPYNVPCEYIPYEAPYGQDAGYYDDLVYQIFLQEYDAVVGATILANRSKNVDFTFPYTESGVATLVRVKDNERKNAWIFLKPLTRDLWLTIGAFFVFTGLVVWVLEHRVNKEFRGPPAQQVGMILWFSFSTIVFAHREKVTSNLTRFVVIIWVFVVLVLTSSYTASLTSMLTVQQLQPTITDIRDLIKNGEYVGYQDGSFVRELLTKMKFESSKIRSYRPDEYEDALSNGSRNGGVAAIVDEVPYIRLFLSKHCNEYTMIGPTFPTPGFGFAFPKGSPLVPDVSRAILKLKEDEKMEQISRKWFKDDASCLSNETVSESLNLDSFKGLFLIAGLSSSLALVIFLSTFLYENRCILTATASTRERLYRLARAFNQGKDDTSLKESRTPGGTVSAPTPAISIPCHQEGMFSQVGGFSTTEPETPIHRAIEA